MIDRYNKHSNDLGLLKQAISNHPDRDKARKLALAYDLYVNSRHRELLQVEDVLGSKKTLLKEGFYKEVKRNLDDSKIS